MSTDQKIKTSTAKPDYAQIPMRALVGVARVFAYGARKYAPGNFLRAKPDGETITRYLSAAYRHLGALQQQDGTYTPQQQVCAFDDESGLYHLDHAIAGLIMLRAILNPGDPGVGNAPPKGPK